MSRGLTTAAAACAAIALGMSGCAAAEQDDSASAVQAETFPGVYAQTIGWGECGDEFGLDAEFAEMLAAGGAPVDAFECAMVEAPLDWNDARNHETIELAVTRVPATGDGEPAGALFGNPGGPGGSGLDHAYGMAAEPSFGPVLERYDLVGFDPRGIGFSTPLGCDPDVSDIDEVTFAICAEEHPLARSMGTSQVARDMDLLRTLLDRDRMDYLGYSYGTMLGATYATLFPEWVGRMVLDSAEGSTWASPLGTFRQQAAIARQVIEMLQGCGEVYEVEACPLATEQQLMDRLAQLDDQPLTATDGTEITGGELHGYLVDALYQPATGRANSLDTAGRALLGEQNQIDEIAAARKGGGMAVGLAGTVVRCHSFPEDPDIIGLIEYMEQTEIPLQLGGPELSDETLKHFTGLGCDALPGAGDDITDSFSGSPDSTILVVGITGDHATPYEGAQHLTEQLGNARLLTLEDHGHGASYSGRSACIDDAVTAFLAEGELPPDGTVCEVN